jgi:replicative DNA helicase
MAKELNVPVIAISQLNRGPEQRTDKRPMLSDLRESGSIEQDADVVILLHREDMYDSQNRQGEADLMVAKHRNGPTRTIPVSAQLHFARFFDLAQSQTPYGSSEPATAPTGYVPTSPYGDQQPAEPGDGGWNE